MSKRNEMPEKFDAIIKEMRESAVPCPIGKVEGRGDYVIYAKWLDNWCERLVRAHRTELSVIAGQSIAASIMVGCDNVKELERQLRDANDSLREILDCRAYNVSIGYKCPNYKGCWEAVKKVQARLGACK